MHTTVPYKIFIVEDDVVYSKYLHYQLSLNPDYEVSVFHNGKDCLNALDELPQVITLDYSLPDFDGANLLQKIKSISPETQVIIISGQEDIQTAIDLLKEGAYDYIVKNPDIKTRIWNTVNNIRQNFGLRAELELLKEEIIHKYEFEKTIIGQSEAMKTIFSLIEKAAKTNITVSINGETGTGKELIAKSIHYNSSRAKKKFVAVNVAAIPKDLIESELFGHEKGAFTGAASRRIGKFEEADKGTLFLDEIAEFDLNLQSKLLRVLQEKELSRVGGNDLVPLDVRIITATHKNLAEEVKKGNFREDLYYRLLGLPIGLPPLRDRGNDILLIAKHIINDFCKENKLANKKLGAEAREKLLNYHFPGNVRELKAIIELAIVMSDEEVLKASDFTFSSSSGSLDSLMMKELTMEEYNQRILSYFLDKYNQNVPLVAQKLGIGKSTIYRMIQEGRVHK